MSSKKKAVKRPSKTSKKGGKKQPTRKSPTKKTAARKPAKKKPSTRKPAKKSAPRKTAGRKPATRKVSKKTAGKKTAARTAPKRGSTAKIARKSASSKKGSPAPARKAGKKPRRLPREELRKIRDMLSQKRRALTQHIQAELIELERPEKKHRADLEEIASDTHETDSLCEIMGIESTQIEQIEKALAKIDNGTYGVCEDCGGDIPMVRLEALPFATQCIECKRKAELEGEFSAASAFRV